MSQATEAPAAGVDFSELRHRFLRAYRWMLLSRLTEEKIASLYRGGKIIGGVFLGRGQEAVSVALGLAMRKGDVFAPFIRDQAARLAFGESLIDCTRTYVGSPLGPMRGRDGNVHRGRPHDGILPMISHLGAMIPVVNGVLMARQFRGLTGTLGVASIGEGATSTGAFHEGLNQAAVERLPLLLVVTNNQYAYSTPNSRQFACDDLLDKAVGYGVEGHGVDGTELEDCLTVLAHAAARARGGHGPQMVVATTLRLTGHGEHDSGQYVDPALRLLPSGRDPLQVAEARLLQEGWAERAEIERWTAECWQQIDEAFATALREGTPDPGKEDWRAISTVALIDGFTTE